MGDESGSSEKRDTIDVAESQHAKDVLVNASGHKQELERNFSLLSICAVAVTTGNTWIALGGGLVCGHFLPLLGDFKGYVASF